MKKFYLSIIALLVACVAMAENNSCFYINDFSVRANQRTITVPVKAHFNGRVSGFQVGVSCPDGLTPKNAASGKDMIVTYQNIDGEEQASTVPLMKRDNATLFMGASNQLGYWDPIGIGDMECYGVAKWEAGDYNEMILLTMQVEDGFEGGQITLSTLIGAGEDSRGGTVTDLGEEGQVFTSVCNVEVLPPVEGYHISIGDAVVLHGDRVEIPISMTNNEPVIGFQADLYLPEGFELVKGDKDDHILITPSDRMKEDHTLEANEMPDGAVRFLSYSENLTPYEGNEGVMFYITVSTPFDISGDFDIDLKKCLVTTASMEEVTCDDFTGVLTVLPYLKGDANNSRSVNVADIVTTAQYILGYDPNPFQFGAADMNENGDITVTDVTLIAQKILYPSTTSLMHAPMRGNIDDSMSGSVTRMTANGKQTVAITLDNVPCYTAFQFDLLLPQGLTPDNFQPTDRTAGHNIDMNMLDDGKMRVMCYSAGLDAIQCDHGTVLTFELEDTDQAFGEIAITGIEMVTTTCQTVYLDDFTINLNDGGNTTAVNELNSDLHIYSDGQNIIVDSPISQQVVISDMTGKTYSVNVDAGRTVVPARLSGVLVVNAGGKSTKLMVR